MYCPSCGLALSRQVKYCSRCGSPSIITKEAAVIEVFEERLNKELVDLFWLTVIGLGLILGGLALLKTVNLGNLVIIAYLVLSSLAFTVNFGLSLWQIRRLARGSKEASRAGQIGQLNADELDSVRAAALAPASSVTENTTRELEPRPKERVTG